MKSLIEKSKQSKFVIFDNNGETLDRFTIIDLKTGDMFGASLNPFHPQGFGQNCGNPAWDYFTRTVGANFMRKTEKDDPKHYRKLIREKTAEIVREFESEGNIGKIIEFEILPEDVKKYVIQVTIPQLP